MTAHIRGPDVRRKSLRQTFLILRCGGKRDRRPCDTTRSIEGGLALPATGSGPKQCTVESNSDRGRGRGRNPRPTHASFFSPLQRREIRTSEEVLRDVVHVLSRLGSTGAGGGFRRLARATCRLFCVSGFPVRRRVSERPAVEGEGGRRALRRDPRQVRAGRKMQRPGPGQRTRTRSAHRELALVHRYCQTTYTRLGTTTTLINRRPHQAFLRASARLDRSPSGPPAR